MQTSTQTETQAAPVVAPGPSTVTIVGADGKLLTLKVPRTSSEVAALVDQRRQLSSQLESVTDRRQQLSTQIGVSPDGVAKTGLEDRIRVLDQRILQIESDLAVVGRQLSAAPAEMVAVANIDDHVPPSDSFDEGMAAGAFTMAFFVAVIYGIQRLRGRKKRKQPPAPAIASDSTDRLERLERGMEAIAIEIERVSEGQRFVTKLLSESATPLGASHRIAQPEQQPVKSTSAPTL